MKIFQQKNATGQAADFGYVVRMMTSSSVGQL